MPSWWRTTKKKRFESSTRFGAEAERRVRRFYRLRGYRILGANVRAGGNELDIVARRGGRLVVCEVKARSGPDYGDPWEAVGPEKERRLRRAAEGWIARNPELQRLEVACEVVAVRGRKLDRVVLSS
jgi:putative endonuclease